MPQSDASRPGSQKITVLLLEDGADDAVLLHEHLVRSGAVSAVVWARTRDQFLAQLSPAIDVVISDYFMPELDTVQTLGLIRERGLSIPVIAITGSLDEEIASRTLRCGAAEFVTKDRLARLVPALIRAVADRVRADEASVSAARLGMIAEHVQDAIIIISDLWLSHANAAAARLLGLARPIAQQAVSRHLPGIGDHLAALAARQGARAEGRFETALEDAHGRRRDVEVICSRLPVAHADEWQLIIRDRADRT